MTFKILKPLLLGWKLGFVSISQYSFWTAPTGVGEHSVPRLHNEISKDRLSSRTDNSNNEPELALPFDLNPKTGLTEETVGWNTLQKRARHGGGYVSAILPRFMIPGGLRRKKELLPTAYLDALRGWAALIVVNAHRFEYKDTWVTNYFGILIAGRGMVDIFFVISGYVLSYRMLMLIRNQETARLLDSLASSTFRRFLRLYLSSGIATFIAMLLVCMGWTKHSRRKPTLYKEFLHWVDDLLNLSNPFAHLNGDWGRNLPGSSYLVTLWTIPVEFRGSVLVFAFCTASCKLSTKHRMMLCWVIVLLSYYWRAYYAATFLSGVFIADLSLGRHPERLKPGNQLPQHDDYSTAPQRTRSIAIRFGYVIALIVAIYLLGPDSMNKRTTFPSALLRKVQPKLSERLINHFWGGIGAFLLVLTLESVPELQKPLKSDISQYLGDISFGVYAMHMLVTWTLYDKILTPLRIQYLGHSNWAKAPVVILNYVAVLWVADYFARLDDRAVRLGRHLQSVMFLKWEN